MANHLRGSAENYDRSGTGRLEENSGSSDPASKEFFNRWLHRKQETELLRNPLIERRSEDGKNTIPATRLSRVLHRLDLNVDRNDRNIYNPGIPSRNELRADHREDYSKERTESHTHEAEQEEKEPGEIKEAVFDIRHEELDEAALSTGKPSPTAATQDEEENSEEDESTVNSQQPTALSIILASKDYTQATQPTVPIVTPTPSLKTMLLSYKAYIIYGFLSALAVLMLILIANFA